MRRFSIPTRIFAAFVVTIVGFVAVSGVSVWQHKRTADELRLLRDGYLPLASRLVIARFQQAGVHRQSSGAIGSEPEALSLFKAALQVQPSTLRQIESFLGRAERLETRIGRSGGTTRLRASINEVRIDFELLSARYERLVECIEEGLDTSEQRREIDEIEVRVGIRLRDSYDSLQNDAIGAISADIAERERQSVIVLGVLTFLALLLGLATTLVSQRLLRPLPRLQERVAALRGGDLSPHTPISEAQDEIGRLAVAFEEMVSALAARDHRLNETKERLLASERLAAIGRMAAHVTHEVRNPLSSIGLNVEMLGDELGGETGEAHALMTEIQKEIERLRGITEEYLRLARVPHPELHDEEPSDFLESLAGFVRREMEAGGAIFDVRIEPSLPVVRMDEGQIRQAILNLLRNARQASGMGTVRLSAARRDDGIAVTVEDDGEGIDTADRGQIFDLFFTTKEQGSGLGLPLTQQIVLAHGGRIHSEDQFPRGTRFSIWLPFAQA